ncbi:hypothetical protein H9P43_003146 [Blastocladiella emersonii ATCC 22665]|nr:hypothetical protein H9P43_003146 [Blastocladiella emersonii ATCC 22665]
MSWAIAGTDYSRYAPPTGALAAAKAAQAAAVALAEPPPVVTTAVTAPEGVYTLAETINVDTRAYAPLAPADRDTPVRISVVVHANAVPLVGGGGGGTLPRAIGATQSSSFASLTRTASVPHVVPGTGTGTDPVPIRKASSGFIDYAGVPLTPPAVPDGANPLTSGNSSSGGNRLGGLFGGHRRQRAKSMVGKSNSTFIARLATLENLADVVRDRTHAAAREVVYMIGDSTPMSALTSGSTAVATNGSASNGTAAATDPHGASQPGSGAVTPSGASVSSGSQLASDASPSAPATVSLLNGASPPHGKNGGGSDAKDASSSSSSSSSNPMSGLLKGKRNFFSRSNSKSGNGKDKEKDKDGAHQVVAPTSSSSLSSAGILSSTASLFSSSLSSAPPQQQPTVPLPSLPHAAFDHAAGGPAAGFAHQQQHPHSWLVMNLGKSIVWLDEQDRKIIFSRLHFIRAIPTCIAVNPATVSTERMDVIVGFSSGDLMWYETMHHRYNRINKFGTLHNKPVTQVVWVPGSESQFLASFADGTILLLDKDREDREMEKEKDKSGTSASSTFTSSALHADEELLEQRDMDGFEVIKPRKGHKHNPLSVWRMGKFVHGAGKAVTDMAFSPDGAHLAVVGLDGCLRVINYHEERITDTYESFFGGLLCVTFSIDGKLILTGGQDDLISVWSHRDRRLLARLRGHTSWVSQIAFDAWRCDSQNHRIGSVGQDGKLLFWDFPVKNHARMSRPPAAARGMSFNGSLRHRAMSGGSTMQPPPPPVRNGAAREHVVHPSVHAAEVPTFEPIMIETISRLPLWSLAFSPDAVVVGEKRGRVLVWQRPASGTGGGAAAAVLAGDVESFLSVSGSGSGSGDATSIPDHLRSRTASTSASMLA